MPGHPERRRRFIRLPDYDYSLNGAYFVTICCRNREEIFKDERLRKIVETYWFDLPRHYPRVELDEFVIMPNHVHGILVLVGAGSAGRTALPVRADKPARSRPRRAGLAGLRPSEPAPTSTKQKNHSLSEIVRFFKTYSSREINRLRQTPGLPVWQRNYYEHIIRGEKSLFKIREYIAANPLQWEFDWENPQARTDSIKRTEILEREKNFQKELKTADP